MHTFALTIMLAIQIGQILAVPVVKEQDDVQQQQDDVQQQLDDVQQQQDDVQQQLDDGHLQQVTINMLKRHINSCKNSNTVHSSVQIPYLLSIFSGLP